MKVALGIAKRNAESLIQVSEFPVSKNFVDTLPFVYTMYADYMSNIYRIDIEAAAP